MAEVHFAVYQSGVLLIEQVEHPRTLRVLPDQRVGVRYRQLVYPLRERAYIDLADDSFDPAYCPPVPLLEDDAKRIFHVERTGSRTYIAWDGSEAHFDALSANLNAIDVRLSDLKPSIRTADNGIRYAAYATIWNLEHLESYRGGTGLEDLSELVEAATQNVYEIEAPPEDPAADIVLPDQAESPTASIDVSALVELSGHYYRLESENRELRSQRDTWDGERSGLVERLHQLNLDHISEREQWEAERTELSRQVEQLTAKLALSQNAPRGAENRVEPGEAEALHKRVSEQEGRIELLENALRAEREKTAADRAEIDQILGTQARETAGHLKEKADLTDKVADLKRQLSACSALPYEVLSGNEQGRVILQQVIRGALPSLRFYGASLEKILSIPNRESLCHKLQQISKGDEKGKAIKARRGWFDTHISDGRDDQLRAYFRPRGGGVVDVLIGFKSNQKADIDLLGNI